MGYAFSPMSVTWALSFIAEEAMRTGDYTSIIYVSSSHLA
jgi:hypothetical protein